MKEVFKYRLLKLADTIEDHPHVDEDGKKLKLDMRDWGHQTECGTIACMAGFAVMQKSRAKTWKGKIAMLLHVVSNADVRDEAAEYLGLDNRESSAFFHPYWGGGSDIRDEKITARRVGGVIRHFVKTGEVDWNIKRLPKRGEVS